MHRALPAPSKALLALFAASIAAFVSFSASAALSERQTITPNPQRVKAPKDYTIGGALTLREDVGFEFLSTTGPVVLDIGRITNDSSTTTSGTVRIALLATVEPSPTGTYWTVASTDLGTLGPGFTFGPLSRTASYAAPPDGVYYLHMAVLEFEPGTCPNPSGYCIDDWVTFETRVQVSGGQVFAVGASTTVTAVEYLHTGFGHYFITTVADEIALLDAGAFQGWVRTGKTFKVWPSNQGSMSGVCRFFSTSFAPRSSHFYTPFENECSDVLANPDWEFETIAFYVQFSTLSGNCAAGTQPLYRLYNNGMSGAPNHRYTVDVNVRQQMIVQGWVSEGYGPLGVIACVPL